MKRGKRYWSLNINQAAPIRRYRRLSCSSELSFKLQQVDWYQKEYKSTVYSICFLTWRNQFLEIILGGIEVSSLLDTGSSTSLIVLKVVEMIGKEIAIDTQHF